MYITDPSLAGEGLTAEQERLREGLEVLIFSNDMNLFPHVAKPGDIIRFHRVIVSILNFLFSLLVHPFMFCSVEHESCSWYSVARGVLISD